MNPSSAGYLISLVLVTFGVTYVIRAFPFVLFGSGKRPPEIIRYIGSMLSPAAIAMLVVYCFACYARDRMPSLHGWGGAEFSAALTVVLLHLWKRNPLLSIVAGTAVYMILVQTILP